MNRYVSITLLITLIVSAISLFSNLMIVNNKNSAGLTISEKTINAKLDNLLEFQETAEKALKSHAERLEQLEYAAETMQGDLDELSRLKTELTSLINSQKLGTNATSSVQTPAASPAPAASPTPAAEVAPTPQPVDPTPAPSASALVYVNVPKLNLRQSVGVTSPVVRLLPYNESLTKTGNSQVVNGMTWIEVKDYKGALGWVATNFVR